MNLFYPVVTAEDAEPEKGEETMKKLTILLAIALMLALPVLGLAETAAAPETTEIPEVTETPAWGMGWGRGRWNQQAPAEVPQAPGFVDENQDGVCDTCGQTPGQNPQAPGFTDENADGVCDHFGTDAQFQGRAGMMQGRSRMAQRGMRMAQGRGRGMMGQGRTQMMRGRMHNAQGQNSQGPNFADANQDGICDFFQNNNNTRPGGRFGR